MRISKLFFQNVYGITEKTIEPGDITLIEGKNRKGKTSFLDAIQTAFSNKGMRSKIIHTGADEAKIFIELDDGTAIDRRIRSEGSDYIKVSHGDDAVRSPETYLKQMFTGTQFNPIRDFIEKKPKEQQKVLLSICKIEWGKDDYVREFGEIPRDYDPGLHVLENLDAIQSRTGHYYKKREDINRERRQKETLQEDIINTLPEDYDPERWRGVSLSELYEKVSIAQAHNNKIDKAKSFLETSNDKITHIEDNYKRAVLTIEKKLSINIDSIRAKYNDEREILDNQIESLEERIRAIQKQIENIRNEQKTLKTKESAEISEATKLSEARIHSEKEKVEREKSEINRSVEQCKKTVKDVPQDVEGLKAEAIEAERMKGFVKESDRVRDLGEEITALQKQSDELTSKIERARALPGILLKTADMPIKGLSIVDGQVLINDLPLDNLSDMEKMDVAVEVAVHKVGDLKVILVNGLEQLDSEQREFFYKKAKQTGLQWFMTRVADTDELQVIGL